VGQAKAYAGKLQLRFTYASKGLGLYAINMATGTGKTSIAFLIIWMLFAALVEIRRVAQAWDRSIAGWRESGKPPESLRWALPP
jgi:hypothetical protein